MHAPLTREIMADVLRDLVAAHPWGMRGIQDPNRTAEVYLRALTGLPAEAVRWAAQRSVEEDDKFPKPARLRELAHVWSRRNSFTLGRAPNNDPDPCAICGARAEYIPITRRARHLVGEPPKMVDLLDEDGHPVIETVMSIGMHMIHDRYRHGLHLSAEQQEGAA